MVRARKACFGGHCQTRTSLSTVMLPIRVLETSSTYYMRIAVDVLYTYRIRIDGVVAVCEGPCMIFSGPSLDYPSSHVAS